MPPFRRPHLSHRLVLVASGGVVFGGPPDLFVAATPLFQRPPNPLPQQAKQSVLYTRLYVLVSPSMAYFFRHHFYTRCQKLYPLGSPTFGMAKGVRRLQRRQQRTLSTSVNVTRLKRSMAEMLGQQCTTAQPTHIPHINSYRSIMLSLARRRALAAVVSAAARSSAPQLLYPPLYLRRSTSSILPDAAPAADADIATPVVRMYTADAVDAAATPAVRMLQRVDAGVPTAEYLEGGQLSPDSIPTRMIEIPCPFSHGGPRQYETVKVSMASMRVRRRRAG